MSTLEVAEQLFKPIFPFLNRENATATSKKISVVDQGPTTVKIRYVHKSIIMFKVIRKFFLNHNKSFRWHLGDYEKHIFFPFEGL